MVQVVKYLPSNCKALSSNPSTAKKKKKQGSSKALHHSQDAPIEEVAALENPSMECTH
jgi:hypothetical protein